MDKNKSFYLTLVVVFCVVLSGFGGYFIGTHFGEKDKVVENNNVNENNEDSPIGDLNYYVLTGLYSYLFSGNNDFEEYLNSLTNSQKLYIAGIFDEKNKTFSDLKANLVKYFGSDLNVKAEDYYVEGIDEALLKYDKSSDKFISQEVNTDSITDLGLDFIYNYKYEGTTVKNNEEITITFYGLYAYQDEIGPTTISNNSNIERLLNYEDESNNESDEEYLEAAFNNNKDDFLKFSYTYKKVNDKYVLVDFKQA